jgi:hypothetical protein
MDLPDEVQRVWDKIEQAADTSDMIDIVTRVSNSDIYGPFE